MRNKTLILIIFIITSNMGLMAQDKSSIVLIETTKGNIKIKLYDETPLHKENFLKLIKEGVYEDLLFHRVIDKFMIQGGDPDSRHASDTAFLGNGDLGYMVDSEFRLPHLFHKRGILAAAREGDDVNPTKASSACQFYIVTGDTISENKLKEMEKQRFEKLKLDILKRLQSENADKVKELYRAGDRVALGQFREGLQDRAIIEAEDRKIEAYFTDEQKEIYTTIGGVPRLDGSYTVFGEVLEGLNVADAIGKADTDRHDRPKENIRMKITIIEE